MSPDASRLISGNSAGYFFFWESMGAQLINQSSNNSELLAMNGQAQQPSIGTLVNYGVMNDFMAIQEMEAHQDQYILKLKLSSSKELLATCSSDRSCKIWRYAPDSGEYEAYKVLSGHNDWVWDCDFTEDQEYCLTVSTDKMIRIWKIDEQTIRKVIKN